MGKQGVGLIGPSGWGRAYCEALGDSLKAKLVAVAGGRRAAATAERFGVRLQESVEALCSAEDIAFVVVASPHHLHREHAVCALRHGKHTLVEKPMATTVADCDLMIAAAREHGAKLMVAHSRRYFPILRKAKQLIDQGVIGKPLMLRQVFCHDARGVFGPDQPEDWWLLDPKAGLSWFMGFGCHHIDYTHWLIGSKVTKVYARVGSYWTQRDVPTCGMYFLDFESGAYSTLWDLSNAPKGIGEWPPFFDLQENNEIAGEEGLMVVRPYQKLMVRTQGDWETVLELPKEKADPVRTFLREEVEDLIESAAEGKEPPITGADGRHTVEIIEAGYRSSESGQPVDLPL